MARHRRVRLGAGVAHARSLGDSLGVSSTPSPFKSTGGGGGTVTHGSQIDTTNTGFIAYYDPTLGRNLVQGDLQVVTTSGVWISDFTGGTGGTAGSPKVVTKKDFQGGLVIDVPYVIVRGCRINGGVTANTGTVFDYCTWANTSVVDQCIQYDGYTANRCNISGGSDGMKANGGNTVITECYIRNKAAGPADHNDGVQNDRGNGPVTIARCNIDARPIGGGGGTTAAILADTGPGLHTITDNYIAGGTYTLMMYDSTTWVVTGNVWEAGSWVYGPCATGGPGWGPSSIITWSNNTLSTGGAVAKP